ncbi:MAG: VOC family protein [bacterium]|nr:VOC family protein [bacterium]
MTREQSVPDDPRLHLALDHLVLADADLVHACEAFADRTGVAPKPGGPHEGLGTQNALAHLGDGLYVELIVPDPATSTDRNLGGLLATFEGLRLFAWALRTDDLPRLARALDRHGTPTSPIAETSRRQPDGRPLVWDLMGLPGLGGAWPFFIDWRDCDHPSRTAPKAGALSSFEASLSAPDAADLPFAAVPGVRLTSGPPRLALTIETQRGDVTWSTEAPRGFYG